MKTKLFKIVFFLIIINALFVSSAFASLSVTPSPYDFGSTETTHNFIVRNLAWGSGARIDVSVYQKPSWVSSVNPDSFRLNPMGSSGDTQDVTVTINRTGLAPGPYEGIITFGGAYSGRFPTSVDFIISMRVPNPPQLSVSPDSYNFGESGTSCQFSVQNTGEITLNWSATAPPSWLTLDSYGGSLGQGALQFVTATVNRGALAPETYTGTINFTGGGGQSVSVSMTVADTTPPGAPTNVDDGMDGWSSDNTPTFTWVSPGDTSGIEGYWWAVDDDTPETGGVWTSGTTATTSPLSEGTHTFYVKAQDGSGLIGSFGSHQCQIDATGPGAPANIDDGVVGWSSHNTPTFTWVSPGDTSGIEGYWWAVDDATPETGGVWTAGTTATTSPLSNGTHTFYVKARNGSGLIGVAGSHDCQIDTTAPGAPANVDDGVVGWSSDNTPTFTWVSPGDTSGIEGYWWAIDDATPETGGVWTVGTTATTSPLSEGTYTFYVKAQNGSGLIGSFGSHQCQIDATPPGAPTNVDDGMDGWNGDNTPTFTWGSPGDTSGIEGYWWAIDDDTPETGGTWTTATTATTSPLSEGTHTFYVKAQNGSELIGSFGSHQCQIDATPPGVPTNVDDGVDGWKSDNTPTFTWGSPGDTSGIEGYWWAIDDDTPETGGTWTTATTATTTPLSDGEHTFYVKAQNGSGLIGSFGSHQCQIDATPPGVPENVDDGVEGWSNDNPPTFTWESPGDTSGIEGYWWAVDDPTPETGGVWTTATTATIAPLSDGEHTFYVKAQNGSGLIGSFGSHQCQIGATPPGAPTNVDDAVDGWSPDNTPTFTWDSPGDPSGIDGYWWAVDDPTPETGGVWTAGTTATTSPLSEGTHTFYVKAENGSGLIGAAGSHLCQIDTTPPGAPTNVDDGVEGWSSDNTPTFTWDSPGDTSGIEGYWWAIDDETPETGGVWTTATTATIAPLSDGTHTFYVKAQNGSGLIGVAGSHQCQIDATVPGAPTNVDDGVEGWSSDNTPTFTWVSPGDISGIEGYWWAIDDPTPETGGVWTTETTGTTSPLSGGTHTFYVKAENGSGLIGAAGSHLCQIDTTPPGAPTNVDDGVEGWSSDNTPTFTWESPGDPSGIEGYWWAVDDPAPEIGGMWTIATTATTVPLSDGEHTFYVKAQDGSAVIGAAGSHVCQIDTTLPGPPTNVDDGVDGWSSDNTPTFTWDSPGDISGIERYWWAIDDDTPERTTATTGTTSPLSDGEHTFYVKAENGSGLIGSFGSHNCQIDATPPDNPTLVLKDRTTGRTEYTHERLVDVEVGDDSGVSAWLISGTQSTRPEKGDSRWGSEPTTFQLTTTGEGPKTVYIWVKDAADNVNPGPAVSVTITLDTIRPTVELVLDEAKARILPDGEIVGVLPDTGMEAKFSKVMDTESVKEGLKLIAMRDNLNNSINEEVSLDFEWEGSTKTVITPVLELKKNYLYSLKVTDMVTDLAGNTVEGEREIIFRTIMDHEKNNVVIKWSNEEFKVMKGTVTVTLEANALTEDGYLIINTEPLTYQFRVNPENISVANEKSITNGWYPIEGCLWEIKVCKENGDWMEDKFGSESEVKITFPYPYDEEKEVVKDALIPLMEETLLAFWLNEEHSNWVRVPGSRVDRDNKVVVTGEVPSFSVFGLMGSAVYDLSDAHAYPVPWKPNDGKDETGAEQDGITFTTLSSQGVIKIYSISGELVREYDYKPADGGKWTWDVKTSSGEKVFSGVYIYYIKNEKEQKTGRLMIIR